MSRIDRWGCSRSGWDSLRSMGATVTLYLLLATGMSDLTVWATAATLFFLVLSRLIFAGRDRNR